MIDKQITMSNSQNVEVEKFFFIFYCLYQKITTEQRRRPGHVRDYSGEYKIRARQNTQGKRELQNGLLHVQ